MAGVGLGLTLALLSLTLRCWPVHSHGRLYEPPGRSTAHSRGFDTPANYNDMGLNCGGFSNQWDVHGGKCGVCGDPWQGPRENEAGGLYATGTIVRQFTMGEYMPIVLEITAPHRGWFEFRLCPHNDPSTPITQECLNQYKLPIYLHANGTTVTRFYSLETIPGSGWTVGKVYMLAKLPDYVTCTQCVLQWKWHTGNSWGTDPDGNSCVGCGPQEEFYGCADIAIYPPGQGTGGVTLPATPAPTGTGTTTGGDTGSTSAPPTAPGNMKVGCWFTNWAQHRSDLAAKFLPEDIDVNLCTHIYYAFAKVDRGTNGEFTVKPYEDNDFELYSRVIGLKHYKPTLKVLLAVGGWTHGTAAFNEMSATAVTRGQFLRNTIAYLRLHGFDGLDYDWEYPGVAWRGSGPETKQQFSDLVKETRLTFEKDATDTGKERLLATASVGVSSYIVEAGYDIPTMNTYLDWTNLMSYDLHGSWEAFLGHHTALYARSDEDSTQAQINVDFVVRYWISQGYESQKLLLGVGSYGRTFRMASGSGYNLGDAASGAGNPGQYTVEGGLLSYYEVCKNLGEGWTRAFNYEHKVPYAYNSASLQWVGYDDVESIGYKADFACRQQLGGVHMWAIDLDDFKNAFCNQGNYPLLTAVNTHLSRCSSGVTGTPVVSTTAPTAPVSSTTVPTGTPASSAGTPATSAGTPAPSAGTPATSAGTPTTSAGTPATSTATTAAPGGPITCSYDGQFHSDPENSQCYYQCGHQNPVHYCCAEGTYFCLAVTNCKWLSEPCPGASSTGPSSTATTPAAPSPSTSSTVSTTVKTTTTKAPTTTTVPTTSTVPTTTSVPTTTTEGGAVTCGNSQFIPDPTNKQCYYQCAHNVPYRTCCAPGTHWCQPRINCIWDWDTSC